MTVCHSDRSFALLPSSPEGMSGAVSLSSSTDMVDYLRQAARCRGSGTRVMCNCIKYLKIHEMVVTLNTDSLG